MHLHKKNIFIVYIVFLLFSSCDDNLPDTIDYEGEGGIAIPFTFESYTPEIDVGVGSHPINYLFVLDTGSPINLADIGHFNDPAGIYQKEISTLGLVFPSLDLIYENWVDDFSDISGLIGGGLVKYFQWELDYINKTITLFPNGMKNLNPDDSVVSFDLRGGGRYQSENGDYLDVGATRHLINIYIEGHKFLGLLDTGASYIVLAQSTMDTLGSSGRPDHGSTQVVTVNGVISVPLTELFNIAFYDAPEKTKLENIYTTVMPNEFFDPLYDETGKKVDLLIGGSFLGNFKLQFDTPNRKIYVSDPVKLKARMKKVEKIRIPIPLKVNK